MVKIKFKELNKRELIREALGQSSSKVEKIIIQGNTIELELSEPLTEDETRTILERICSRWRVQA